MLALSTANEKAGKIPTKRIVPGCSVKVLVGVEYYWDSIKWQVEKGGVKFFCKTGDREILFTPTNEFKDTPPTQCEGCRLRSKER